MSLISFIRDAGEKLFNKSEQSQAPAAAPAQASPSPSSAGQAQAPQVDVAALNAKAGEAISALVQKQNLGIDNLGVQYDGATERVTLTGTAPSQEAAEKAVLCCGNVSHVAAVDNLLSVAAPQEEAQYHDVAKGDTLSAISKRYYGDPNKYNAIFEANKPMLTSPDKIYPGQKLRIPKLA